MMDKITIGGAVFSRPPLKNRWNLRQQSHAKKALSDNWSGNLMQSLIFGETTAELLGVILWDENEDKFNESTYLKRVEKIKDLDITDDDVKTIEGILGDFWSTRGRSMMSASQAYTAMAGKGGRKTT
jgi:hypothetical protein